MCNVLYASLCLSFMMPCRIIVERLGLMTYTCLCRSCYHFVRVPESDHVNRSMRFQMLSMVADRMYDTRSHYFCFARFLQASSSLTISNGKVI